MVIVSLVFAGLWSLTSVSLRASSRADERLQAGQAFLLLDERIAMDIAEMYADGRHQAEVTGTRLSFWVCSRGAIKENWELELNRVEYRFDEATGKITRRVNGEEVETLLGVFTKVCFSLKSFTTNRASEEALQDGSVLLYEVFTKERSGNIASFKGSFSLASLVHKWHHKPWITRVTRKKLTL